VRAKRAVDGPSGPLKPQGDRPGSVKSDVHVRRTCALIIGAGQIGTFAAGALHESGVDVVGADAEPAPGHYARFGPREGPPVQQVDIRESAQISELVTRWQPDVIVLSAGLPAQQTQLEPDRARATLLGGVQNVLAAAARCALRRLVFVSSFAVYGPNGGAPIKESDPRAPTSIYGRLFAEAEDILLANSLPSVILRPAGVYGPIQFGRGSHSARLFEQLLLRAARGLETSLESATDDSDEYIYVKDVAVAVARAVQAPPASSAEIFNVGTGQLSRMQDVIAAVTGVFPNAQIGVNELADHLNSQAGPLDVQRAAGILGFRARYDLVHGLADYARELGAIEPPTV